MYKDFEPLTSIPSPKTSEYRGHDVSRARCIVPLRDILGLVIINILNFVLE